MERIWLVFLFRKAEHRLYAVKLGHVLALVKQYLAVGVIDDTLLDDGRLDVSSTSCVTTMASPKYFLTVLYKYLM